MAKAGNVIFKFVGDDKDLKSKMESVGKSVGAVGKSIGSAFVKGTAVAGGAIAGMVGKGISEYAKLEQSVGGVETLFKKSADTVIANSKKAYMTAGLDANTYMEQVTSFSASLLQSLAGDTKKAAKYADRAVVDMADNANKMGTSMEMIQNAYQGFAKQNYVMLDNLKLGYGGTKTEMERLISDASKMTEVQKELNVSVKDGDMSFGNIVNAISVMQKSMGIAGTTSKEASETIRGSLSSMKSAFTNFLSGAGGTKEVIDTMMTFGSNVGKAIEKMAPDLIDGIVKIGNAVAKKLPTIIKKLLPIIVNGAIKLIQGLVQVFPQVLNAILGVVPQIITLLIQVLPQILNALIEGSVIIVTKLAEMLPSMLPQIINAILGIIPLLISHLPEIIEAGAMLIIGLAEGLIRSMPEIMKVMPKIIFAIQKATLKLIPVLLRIGVQAILSLLRGIVSNVANIVNSIKGVVRKILAPFKDGFSWKKVGEIGSNLIKGLWNGIKNMKQWVINKIKSFGGDILDSIKSVFGIHSPSKVMFEIGGYLDKGFINGVQGMQDEVKKAFTGTFGLSPNMVNSASTNFSPSINVVNNISMEQDPLGQMVRKVKTFSGGAKNDFNYGMGV